MFGFVCFYNTSPCGRGPAASLTTQALNNAFLFSGFAEKRGGRGEVRTSAGRGEPKTPQPGFAGCGGFGQGEPPKRFPHQGHWH